MELSSSPAMSNRRPGHIIHVRVEYMWCIFTLRSERPHSWNMRTAGFFSVCKNVSVKCVGCLGMLLPPLMLPDGFLLYHDEAVSSEW